MVESSRAPKPNNPRPKARTGSMKKNSNFAKPRHVLNIFVKSIGREPATPVTGCPSLYVAIVNFGLSKNHWPPDDFSIDASHGLQAPSVHYTVNRRS